MIELGVIIYVNILIINYFWNNHINSHDKLIPRI